MVKKTMNAGIAAKKWGVSLRRVNQLCNGGEIDGAIKVGGRWAIPFDAKKPTALNRDKIPLNARKRKLLPCPVGITSYREVSSECYYVDKTLMIKDIIDEHSKAMLFTRPRRFGKTLAMDMLKTFFEKSDEDTSIYFKDREIWKCGEAYRCFQGAYPVIFISFKDTHQNSWEDMYESLILSIRNEFKRHNEVLKSKKVPDEDKLFFKKALDGTASEVEYQASLGQLSRMLSNAYSSRVVVIIDEYDTPIQQRYSCQYYDKVISFVRNLFSSVLKDNDVLEFGILTGILRVAKESLFSGLNNLVVNTIVDERYSSYFGFNNRDVSEMASYYNRQDKLGEIKDWYDGYRFGKTEIYNPWSVISYFNNDCTPKAFWSRTSSNDLILDILRDKKGGIQQALMDLLQDKPVQALIDTDVVYPEISRSEDAIYSFLAMTGYLKITEEIAFVGDTPLCNLLIPNKEIRSVFKKEIIDGLPSNFGSSLVRNIQVALKTNQSELLQDMLREYLFQSASAFDFAHENFYHGMMLGLLAIMSEDYSIVSNKESGLGRFDIQLTPVSIGLPGILMEFKALGKGEDSETALDLLAEEALKQIERKQYWAELVANGVKDIQVYGIAFHKKKAIVKTKRLEF